MQLLIASLDAELYQFDEMREERKGALQ